MSPPLTKIPRNKAGAALVIVLCVLTLATIVCLAYLAASSTEMVASKSYSSGLHTRVLAETALNLVKGQIWAATTETNSALTSWASQPGALRTFRSGDTNLLNVYKLYSSSNMVVPNSSYTPSAEVPTNWASRPDEYVDLNRPVVVGGATNYPVLTPAATGVAGFSNSVASAMTTAYSPLPMPVQWIYVRRDGSMTNSAAATAPFTATNPIVGRIAFWTDDDTCKINVNTAGAARDGETNSAIAATTFWDLPVGTSSLEKNMATYQPAQREYQRYPGHPAKVAMNVVFTNLTATEIYNLTPTVSSADATQGSFGGTRRPANAIALKSDRLYASLDELMFATNRTANNVSPATLDRLRGFVTAYNRAPELNLFGRPRVSMWPVASDSAKRSPMDKWFALCSTMSFGAGTNLFAVTRSDATSSTKDLKVANATIPKLFAYLQNQTKDAPPGATSSFLTKYGASGRDQLITLSLDYIRCVNLYDSSMQTGTLKGSPYNPNAFTQGEVSMTGWDRPGNTLPWIHGLPGFGQVVPLNISPADVPTSSGTFKGLGRFDTTISEAAFHFWALSYNDGTAVREDDVWTIGGTDVKVGDYFTQPQKYRELVATSFSGPPKVVGTNAPMYAAQLLISPFNTMCGFNRYGNNYLHKVTGLSTFTVNGLPIFPADPAVNWVRQGGSKDTPTSTPGGGFNGVMPTVNNSGCQFPPGGKGVFFDGGTVANPSVRDYPLASVIFPFPEKDISGNATTTMPFSGGTLTIEILTTSGEKLQELDLSFPATDITKPQRCDQLTSTSTAPYRNDTWKINDYPWSTPSQKGTLEGGRRMRTIAAYQQNDQNSFFFDGDVIVGVEANGPATDFRWLSLQSHPASSLFKEHPQYYSTTTPNSNKACGLRYTLNGSAANGGVMTQVRGVTTAGGSGTKGISTSGSYLGNKKRTPLDPAGAWQSPYCPVISSRYLDTGIKNAQGKLPDFDNGVGGMPDGAYSRKPDEGAIRISGQGTPYYLNSWASFDLVGETTYFAPNRQVPSAGIMGGLPSRATEANGAWETLLFCPNPAAGTTSSVHRGFLSPPDYFWMDLFTMPIVEPYAISEPFSTAGKINMNFQIVPFTYVTRSTGLCALLAGNKVSAILGSAPQTTIRYPINPDQTLKQFQAKFDSGQIFKSATEICSMWLYPGTPGNPALALVTDTPGSTTGIQSWWYTAVAANDKSGTGDNLREQPYTVLYPNLTTQSNTFTTHVTVQALAQAPSGKISVTGEYRGSFSIERFLDPKNPNLPDFTDPAAPNAMAFYQFRVNNTKQFLP